MKSILDPTFRYTSSANTDVAKTFARVRREQKRAIADQGLGAVVANVSLFTRPPDRKAKK
jgi:hypothetical protein